MGLWDKLFGGASILDGVSKIIGNFKLSPEKKAELEAMVEAHKFEFDKLQLEYETKIAEYQAREIEAAGANIRAETQSGDKYTARARPTFMYLMYVILSWNFVLLPLIQYLNGKPPVPIDLPPDIYYLFGAGYLGYVGARGWEKIAHKGAALK